MNIYGCILPTLCVRVYIYVCVKIYIHKHEISQQNFIDSTIS